MGANGTPLTQRSQNPGFVASRTSYNAFIIVACMYIVWAFMTFPVEIGNSTQQLVALEGFLATKEPRINKDLLEKKAVESSRDTKESEAEKDHTKKPVLSSLPSLSNITQGRWLATQCEEGMIYKSDFVASNDHDSNRWNHIPKIIHQTSRSRCLTQLFNRSTSKWSDWHSNGWSYYFHDDDAMHRMFEMNYVFFPSLKDVVENCLISGTAKADLWRYLVLWQYGGIYSDLDATPNNLKPDTFSSLATEESELEAFFTIESFHFLSQYFFGIAPKHPLMHHTILGTLQNLLAKQDTVAWDASWVTGPKALHQGFVAFLKDAGIKPENGKRGLSKRYRHNYIVSNATIMGTGNHTVASYGNSKEAEADYWVWRYDKNVSSKSKNDGYTAMGMEHFGRLKKRPSGVSCQQAIKNRHLQDATAKYTGTKKFDGI